MKVENINPCRESQIYNRIQKLCDKAKASGDDTKTTAELLVEIYNIGLENVINYLG